MNRSAAAETWRAAPVRQTARAGTQYVPGSSAVSLVIVKVGLRRCSGDGFESRLVGRPTSPTLDDAVGSDEERTRTDGGSTMSSASEEDSPDSASSNDSPATPSGSWMPSRTTEHPATMEDDAQKWAPATSTFVLIFLAWTYLTGIVSYAGQYRDSGYPATELVPQLSLETVLLRGAASNVILFLILLVYGLIALVRRYNVFWTSAAKAEKERQRLETLTARLEAGPTRPLMTKADIILIALSAIFFNPTIILLVTVPLLAVSYVYATGRVRPYRNWTAYWVFIAAVWAICLLAITYLYPTPLPSVEVHFRDGSSLSGLLVIESDSTVTISEDEGDPLQTIPASDLESWDVEPRSRHMPRSLSGVLWQLWVDHRD